MLLKFSRSQNNPLLKNRIKYSRYCFNLFESTGKCKLYSFYKAVYRTFENNINENRNVDVKWKEHGSGYTIGF